MSYKDATQILNYEHYTDSKTFSYAAAQTNKVMITPSTGKALRIHDVYINTAATSGQVALEFTNSGYNFCVFDIASGNSVFHLSLREVGQINESIRLNTAITSALNISINWAEVGDAGESSQNETSTSTSTTTTSTSTTTTSTSSTTTSSSTTTTSSSTSTSSSTTTTTSTTTTSTSTSTTSTSSTTT